MKFTESEIYTLADSIVSALLYFKSLNINHNAISTKNVYITQHGEFKIADPALFQYENYFEKVFKNRDEQHEGIFLSPAQMSAIEKNIEVPIHDKEKTDVY